MAINPCSVMVLLYGINSLKFFFQAMIWLPSLNWSHFLWNDSYKLTKMNCKLLTDVQTISSYLSLLNVLLWNVVLPATQSSNLMVEIDTVIYMDIGVMHFMCLYVYICLYICLYRYVLFAFVCADALVHSYIYLHIHLVLIGDSLDSILHFEVLYISLL